MSRGMGNMSRRGLMLVAFLAVLAVAQTASADMLSVSLSDLSDFVIFSGGGLAINGGTEIGGHTHITGDIGSNQDLFLQGNPLNDYPAQLDGSAYAGGNLTFGQDLTVGSSSGPLRDVVANGAATIGGGADIYGNLYGNDVTLGQLTGIRQVGGIGGNVEYTNNYTPSTAIVEGSVSSPSTKTFGLITPMPAATTFTASGPDQEVPAASDELTLAPGTYGALATSQQDQKVTLSSGKYYFDSIDAKGGFTLEIDLTSGNPVEIYVVGDAAFSQNNTIMVKGEGTGGIYKSLDQAPELASLIYMETHGNFTMGGATSANHNIWGGTVYSSLLDVNIGQYMDWYGAVYAFGSFKTADHGTWNNVPLTVVPAPSAVLLAIIGLGFAGNRLKKKEQL